MTITEKKQKMAEAIREWRGIMDTAEDQKRDLTREEAARCEELDATVGLLKEEIAGLDRMNGNKRALEGFEEWARTPADNRNMWPSGVAGTGGAFPGSMGRAIDQRSMDDGGFTGGVAEFLHALAVMKSTGARDERLARLEARDQQMGVGATGGFT